MQEIAAGLVLAATGAVGLWGGMPEHKLPNGQPSMWALRARVGAGLFLVGGLFMVVHGILKALGI